MAAKDAPINISRDQLLDIMLCEIERMTELNEICDRDFWANMGIAEDEIDEALRSQEEKLEAMVQTYNNWAAEDTDENAS
jgi:hypothetical protein